MTPYPFKKISLAIVQISLIAGTFAISANSISSKKGVSSCCVKSQLTRIEDSESTIGLSSSYTDIIIKKAELLWQNARVAPDSSKRYANRHLSRFSGLSPPALV